jgi:hypothetical protein
MDIICYHEFTAGRLNNWIRRRNRNVSRSVTWSLQELNHARFGALSGWGRARPAVLPKTRPTRICFLREGWRRELGRCSGTIRYAPDRGRRNSHCAHGRPSFMASTASSSVKTEHSQGRSSRLRGRLATTSIS